MSDLRILHRAPGWLVIDKPPALPVHSGSDGKDVLTVLAARFPGEPLAAAHRLDADTSGCLLVARTTPALRVLTRAFAERKIHKSYVAVVHGCPSPPAGEIFTHIGPRDRISTRMAVVDPGAGPPALTLYRTLGVIDGNAVLELIPVTGRTHQLRVHLRHLGHPILGDPLYSRPGPPSAGRLMLHACVLEFPDPACADAMIRVESAWSVLFHDMDIHAVMSGRTWSPPP